MPVTLDQSVQGGGFEDPALDEDTTAPADSGWNYWGPAGIATPDGDMMSGGRRHHEGKQAGIRDQPRDALAVWDRDAGKLHPQFSSGPVQSATTVTSMLRVTMRGATSTKTFVWSGNSIAEERDASGETVIKRFYPEGEQRIGGKDAGDYYYSRDHLGSIREVTNENGELAAQYDYDVWGKRVTISGDSSFDFGFTGHYFHQPSGLNLTMYRAYSPTLGRWISRDPMGESEGPNLYSYVANDPINMIDPLGLFNWRRWVPRGPWFFGTCCNRSGGIEWASVAGRGWVMLAPGECVGLSNMQDCEGMTCGGGFYYVSGLSVGSCSTPGCDRWPGTKRRWTPDPTTRDPGGMSPTNVGMGFGDVPPGYQYGPRRPRP